MKNKQKFMHYALEIVLTALGTFTASLIVYSIIVAVEHLPK